MTKFSKNYSRLLNIFFLVYNFINSILLKYKITVVYHYYTDKELLKLINKLRSDGDLLLTVNESLQLFECTKSAQKIKGEFAEVGVFRGGSARLIAEAKGKRRLYLFDTFEGLPPTEEIDKYVESSSMKALLDEVKNKLKIFSGIYFYKGLFQQTSVKIQNKKFAFVHLDADLFSSTKACLEFFYPRMIKGGIILTHDYPFMPGVKKAFDNFFKDKKEYIIKMVGNQGLVVKL